ncbi:MAG TPA: hypothetical protein PKW69_01900 [Niabella sp.]|nr:hypothetical protein [Niabella sp.]
MIENKLTNIELARVLKPILKLEGLAQIKSEFDSVFQEKMQSFDDIIEYTRRYNVTYRGFKIFINGIGCLSKGSIYISLNCRIERKWFHSFYDPTLNFITDLKKIAVEEFNHLSFYKNEINAYPNSYTKRDLERFTYIHDSSAFNSAWNEGTEISPLIISPSKNDKYYFIEFVFNPNCYFRKDNKTFLKENWKEHITDITNYIEQEAIKRMKG